MMNWRKWLIISIVAVTIILVGVMVYFSGAQQDKGIARIDIDRIVVINLSGTIQESAGGLMGGGITPRYVNYQLKRAMEDRMVKGVVLRIETPGGAIAASQEIADMVRNFDKPLVVSMGDMAASGGYYISAPAQGIVAQPGTMTGSIGVISTLMDMEGLYEMLGIKIEVFKSGEHKDMFSRALTEEEREIMQSISDEAYEQFVREVADGRGMNLEDVKELATGQIYLGSQALELGLVDRLGGIDDAIDYLAELNDFKNPVRYEYPQPSLFTQFFDMGYNVLKVLANAAAGPELMMLDKLREGITPDIRYQVR